MFDRIGRVSELPSATIGSIIRSRDGAASIAAKEFRIDDGPVTKESPQPVRSSAAVDRIGLIYPKSGIIRTNIHYRRSLSIQSRCS